MSILITLRVKQSWNINYTPPRYEAKYNSPIKFILFVTLFTVDDINKKSIIKIENYAKLGHSASLKFCNCIFLIIKFMSNYSYIKIEQMDFVVEYDDNK